MEMSCGVMCSVLPSIEIAYHKDVVALISLFNASFVNQLGLKGGSQLEVDNPHITPAQAVC
jgi:hypothetical protein